MHFELETAFFYTYFLKKQLLADVVVLTCLYVMRILSGSIILGVAISQWIAALSFFVFIALCLAKRIAELKNFQDKAAARNKKRAYTSGDTKFLGALAAGSICCATLVVAFYAWDPHAVQYYKSPTLLLAFCPILFCWLARLIMLADRGLMRYDPITFVFKDWPSYVCIGLGALLYVMATIGIPL